MKRVNLFLVCSFLLLISCNPSTTSTTGTTENDSTAPVATAPAIKISSPLCFEQKNAGDTFTLKLAISDTSGVEGILHYGFKEKDSNEGTIAGVMYGDTLIADYHFTSEGKTSVREVAFLVNDSIAIEGYGDMEDKGGKLVFKNSHALTFSNGVLMRKIPCN